VIVEDVLKNAKKEDSTKKNSNFVSKLWIREYKKIIQFLGKKEK